MSAIAQTTMPVVTSDICALPLVRRLAAMLDRDPDTLVDGDLLPRGWHPLLFNAPTRQSQLREDGAAALGVTLPDLGLPRLMLGGRRILFDGHIPIGARVHRETRRLGVVEKHGRSGRFAIVNVEHRIFVTDGDGAPVVVEAQDYILRGVEPASANGQVDGAAGVSAERIDVERVDVERVDAERTLVPDAPLLFRYSSITDNPHRIHYDLPYAQQREGYPALVVNGSIPALFLIELFRGVARREPSSLNTRNVAPMYAGRALRLCIRRDETVTATDAWRLWAVNDEGRPTFEASVT